MRHLHRLTLCLLLVWPLMAAEDNRHENISDTRPRGEAGYLYREIGRPSERWRSRSEAQLEAAAPREAEAYLALARLDLEAKPFRLEPARRRIEKAAEAGLAHGEYLMGYLAANQWPVGDQGGEITGDYELARDWYEKAAAQKHVKAMLELGVLYYTGKLGEHDIARAEKWYQQAAALGSVKAMRKLGELFKVYTPEKNTLVAPQPEQSSHWFQEAAKHGDAESQFQLAQAYHRGFGVPKDPAESLRWLRKASEGGNHMASLVLEGQLPFPEAREEGSTPGRSMGQKPAAGTAANNPPDLALVEQALIGAGALGNNGARLQLGRMYEAGQGAERNVERALGEYAMSSMGSPFETPTPSSIAAVESIIRIYASGELKAGPATTRAALPQDPAMVPNAPARFQLAELFWNGNAVVRADRTNAMRWYLEAARAGSAPAMRRIGKFWEEGINGQPDADEAQRWYRRAEAAEKDGNASAP